MTIMEKGVLARALYTNRPEAKNELFFRKGDILTVIEYDHDGQPGWWLCALRGQRGICPSNYLEVLEDKYSVPAKNNLSITDSKSCNQLQHKLKDESSLEKEGKKDELDSIVNPLETYDFPRSVGDIDLSGNVNVGNNSNSKNVDKGKSLSCAALLTHSHDGGGSDRSRALSIAAPESSAIQLQQFKHQLEHTYSNEEPLYENDCVSLPQEKDSSSSLSTATSTGEPNPSGLDLYDVPRNELPYFGQSITRLRKYGSCSDDINIGNSLKVVPETTTSSSSSSGARNLSTATLGRNLRGRKAITLTTTPPSPSPSSNLPPSPPPPTPPSPSTYPPVQLRRPHRQPHFSSHQSQPSQFNFSHSNRSSSAESGIVMVSSSATSSIINQMQTDGENSVYDVPRGSGAPNASVANLVHAFNSKGHSITSVNHPTSGSSRPSSALSITSSGMGLSIATSDSKDSLDGLYDVPRTSIKAYVNHMETKYDDLARHRNDSCSSLNSSVSSQIQNSPQVHHHHPGHSRHNSTSSIFSAYGYTRNGGRGSISGASLNGGGGGSGDATSSSTSTLGRTTQNYEQQQQQHQRYQSQAQSVDELYDVPRGTLDHPLAQARMLPPPPPSRKPMMGSIAKSNGSLNHNDSDEDPMQFYDVPREFQRKTSIGGVENNHQNNHLNVVSRGISSTSLSSASISGSSFTSANHVANNGSRSRSGSVVGGIVSRNKCDSADVKILPLCPKAAVSVCEKLRQEVVSSIGSILAHVKPKWRSKENLQEIMPDLKFSCTRLCLAIKDMADFASRSLSNAKRLPDDSSSISVRLHRLLTPVINGSQIIQRDVDELEAYFWSIDRLSISNGDSSNNHMNGSGDALDQLILCSRSLKHDVTELANFLALHSTALYKEAERQSLVQNQNQPTTSSNNSPKGSGAGGVSKTKELVSLREKNKIQHCFFFYFFGEQGKGC
ncbi:unnamed protein product [Orchesella dallaii]|uniref:SH3 domain-containing protein n=1 Tax=Orchesella dallaii TaxID=48710 RepID=A0ABP1RQP4_9HEXA